MFGPAQLQWFMTYRLSERRNEGHSPRRGEMDLAIGNGSKEASVCKEMSKRAFV